MHKWYRIYKSKNAVPVPGEMADMDVDHLSLVRKGANKQKIQIYKEDDESGEESEEHSEMKGFFDVVKSFFSGEIQKADTKQQKSFAGLMAVADITEGMWRVNDTLRTVMRDVCNNPQIKDKKAALNQAIDEYCTYMKEKINGSKISKSADFFDEPVAIEKGEAAGKISVDTLVQTRDALTQVINSVKPAAPETDPDKGKKKKDEKQEEDEVKKEDLAKIVKESVTEVVKPLEDRLDKIEKGEGVGDQGEQKTEEEQLADIVKSAVTEVTKGLEERLGKVEKSRMLPNSKTGEEKAKVEKGDEEDAFDGFFFSEDEE